MSFGMEVLGPAGEIYYSTVGDYPRYIDSLNPFALGVPGSVTFDEYDIGFIYRQGNSRILTVVQSGNTISWSYADNFSWPEYSGPALLQVFAK